MDQRIIDLYDDFVHKHFDRRLFLERAAKVLGSAAAAAAALPLLQSDYAKAEVVKPNDPRIDTERVAYRGASGNVKAYLAAPVNAGKRGGVVVVHQNRGLNPHIEDIARRIAVEGFEAMAVDFFSPMGGTPANEDQAMATFSKIDKAGAVADARAGLASLRSRPDSNGKVAILGFCWGGDIANLVAESDPNLDAAVVYYGLAPPLDKVASIKAALLLNYSDPKLDPRVGAGLPAFDQALKSAGKNYTLNVYEGANHGFNDDTQQARYNAEAARNAWEQTITFLKEYIG